jgi:hypothetical protein
LFTEAALLLSNHRSSAVADSRVSKEEMQVPLAVGVGFMQL